jgi:hypothetical protein
VYRKVVGYVVVREFLFWVRGLLGKVMINGWVLICERGILEGTYLLTWRAGFLSVVAQKGRRFCDPIDLIENATEELKRLSQNGFHECFQHFTVTGRSLW